MEAKNKKLPGPASKKPYPPTLRFLDMLREGEVKGNVTCVSERTRNDVHYEDKKVLLDRMHGYEIYFNIPNLGPLSIVDSNYKVDGSVFLKTMNNEVRFAGQMVFDGRIGRFGGLYGDMLVEFRISPAGDICFRIVEKKRPISEDV